jgi:hypothetical protein
MPLSAVGVAPERLPSYLLHYYYRPVDGGWGPYQAKIDWDDGAVQQGSSQLGNFRGVHTYQKDRVYRISLTVTDANEVGAKKIFPITVGDTLWQEDEICDDQVDNNGDGKIDEGCRPNWDNGCVADNSQNTGGATALWKIGNYSPYPGSGLICSDRDGLRWVSHNGIDYGRWNLVGELKQGGSDPDYANCYLAGQVVLDNDFSFGVDWFCKP